MFAYCEQVAAPGNAMIAAAEAFAEFRASVIDRKGRLTAADAERLLRSTTCRVAAHHGVNAAAARASRLAREGCTGHESQLIDYAEDTLAEIESEDFADHLAKCRHCADAVRRLQAGRRAFERPPRAALPSRVVEQLLEALITAAPIRQQAGDASSVREEALRLLARDDARVPAAKHVPPAVSARPTKPPPAASAKPTQAPPAASARPTQPPPAASARPTKPPPEIAPVPPAAPVRPDARPPRPAPRPTGDASAALPDRRVPGGGRPREQPPPQRSVRHRSSATNPRPSVLRGRISLSRPRPPSASPRALPGRVSDFAPGRLRPEHAARLILAGVATGLAALAIAMMSSPSSTTSPPASSAPLYLGGPRAGSSADGARPAIAKPPAATPAKGASTVGEQR